MIRTNAIGEIMTIIIAYDGATVKQIQDARQTSRTSCGVYNIIHRLQNERMVTVRARGNLKSPRYSLTQKGIEFWLEILEWAGNAGAKPLA